MEDTKILNIKQKSIRDEEEDDEENLQGNLETRKPDLNQNQMRSWDDIE